MLKNYIQDALSRTEINYSDLMSMADSLDAEGANIEMALTLMSEDLSSLLDNRFQSFDAESKNLAIIRLDQLKQEFNISISDIERYSEMDREGFFGSIFGAIFNFFKGILNFFKSLFGGSSGGGGGHTPKKVDEIIKDTTDLNKDLNATSALLTTVTNSLNANDAEYEENAKELLSLKLRLEELTNNILVERATYDASKTAVVLTANVYSEITLDKNMFDVFSNGLNTLLTLSELILTGKHPDIGFDEFNDNALPPLTNEDFTTMTVRHMSLTRSQPVHVVSLVLISECSFDDKRQITKIKKVISDKSITVSKDEATKTVSDAEFKQVLEGFSGYMTHLDKSQSQLDKYHSAGRKNLNGKDFFESLLLRQSKTICVDNAGEHVSLSRDGISRDKQVRQITTDYKTNLVMPLLMVLGDIMKLSKGWATINFNINSYIEKLEEFTNINDEINKLLKKIK